MSYRGLGTARQSQSQASSVVAQAAPMIQTSRQAVFRPTVPVAEAPPADTGMPQTPADMVEQTIHDAAEQARAAQAATLLEQPPTEIPWMWIGLGAGALVAGGAAWWFLSHKKKVSANRPRSRRRRRVR